MAETAPLDDADRATLAFFRNSTSAKTLDELTESFARVVQSAGFFMVSCYHVATPGQPVALRHLFGWTKSASWSEHYIQSRLSRYDPVVQAIFTSSTAFTWRELEQRTTTKAGRKVFEDARAFNARGGLVVPIHGPLGEVMGVTMISEQEQDLSPQRRMNLQVAATIYATRGLAMSEIERETTADPGLSRREIQCIYWINEGKTDWEIGRILDISEDTVAYHLKNVKAKLGVTRRSQIPTSAWLRGVLLDAAVQGGPHPSLAPPEVSASRRMRARLMSSIVCAPRRQRRLRGLPVRVGDRPRRAGAPWMLN
jgi:DNA-binding CsgD family transcriptional regulator